MLSIYLSLCFSLCLRLCLSLDLSFSISVSHSVLLSVFSLSLSLSTSLLTPLKENLLLDNRYYELSAVLACPAHCCWLKSQWREASYRWEGSRGWRCCRFRSSRRRSSLNCEKYFRSGFIEICIIWYIYSAPHK